jgi:hypothetical protein
VADVAVGGRLVMEGRKMLTIDEGETLERVQKVYRQFFERADLGPLTKDPEGFWGASRSS